MVAFTIWPATLADAEALCALHEDAVRFRHAMTKGGETLLVAERDGAVVGFASIKGTVLFALFVDPANGRGAGQLLLQAAEG